jgi:putative transcriptional regulator
VVEWDEQKSDATFAAPRKLYRNAFGDKLTSQGRVDRERVRATTDADIARDIAADPDLAPEGDDSSRWERRHEPPLPDVRALRLRLGLSQAEFAQRFGLSARTVQQWEQGRAIPDRPARVLLRVIAYAPQTVTQAVLAG